jgi:DNA-directed RNA polymerase subunit L
MQPKIENIKNKENVSIFTLSGVNFSFANALRRTILSDIPTVVFKTTPYEESNAEIFVNTTRFNNEIIKQRLSCIPIHIKDLDMPLENYLMEVNVENLTDTIMFITTQDFKIKNIKTQEYLNDHDTQKIFPPNSITGYYIDFVRLRPKISDEITGEKIHLTCSFTVDVAKTNGMYNVACTCSYGYTPDPEKIEKQLIIEKQQWRDKGKTSEEIEFESKNWKLLDGLRHTKKDSFDFVVESVGVYSNEEIIHKASLLLYKSMEKIVNQLKTNSTDISIEPAINTLNNSFDIKIEGLGYTIGKIIEYIILQNYFDNNDTITFCSFKLMHPHDTEGVLKIAFKENMEPETIKQILVSCLEEGAEVYKKINDVKF